MMWNAYHCQQHFHLQENLGYPITVLALSATTLNMRTFWDRYACIYTSTRQDTVYKFTKSHVSIHEYGSTDEIH